MPNDNAIWTITVNPIDKLTVCYEYNAFTLCVSSPQSWHFHAWTIFDLGKDQHELKTTQNPDDQYEPKTILSPDVRLDFAKSGGSPGWGASSPWWQKFDLLLVTLSREHMYLIMSWKFSLLANIRPDFSDHTVIEQLVDGSTTCALYGNLGIM